MSIERIYITAGPYQEIITGIQMILSFSDGVVKLTGQEGAGKTSLLQKLQEHIEGEGQQTLLFSPPPKSVLELHNTVTRTFRLGADVSFRKALARHLGSQPRDKQNLVMLFDDADTMDHETLCDLLLFRNVKQGDQTLVSIVLFGSADLDERLSAPELADLVQDIVLNYELNPLDAKQLAAFCEEAIPALGLRISLPAAQVLEHLLQETQGLPGAVLERLPQLASTDTAEGLALVSDTQAQAPAGLPGDAATEDANTTEPLQQEPVSTGVVEAAPEPASETPAKVELRLEPLEGEDEEDESGKPRKALLGGLALVASLAAAWFFFPQWGGLLRSPDSTLVATPAPTPSPAPELPQQPTGETAPAPEPEPAVAQAEPAPANVAQAEPAPEAAPEPAAEQAAPEPQAVAQTEPEPEPQDVAQTEPESPAAPAQPQAPVATSTQPSATSASLVPTFPAVDAQEANEANLLALVRDWLDAWQNQDLDGYFAAYHTDFAPLYQSTRSAWRDNRVRSIQRPSTISIGLDDFTVTGNTEVGVQVGFWMEYQSPGYADRTFKELVIGNDLDGSLRILQEVNRQVVAIAPGEVLSSSPAAQTTASTPLPTATPVGAPVQLGSVYSRAAAPRTAAGVSATLAEEVYAFLGSWLEAWQRQDLEQYFAHYHPEFDPTAHASRTAWQADRSEKISRPLIIQIHLLDLEVSGTGNDRSEVVLQMEYHSTYYADRTMKDLVLSRTPEGSWGIVRERNLEVTPLPIARLVPDRSVTLRHGPGSVYEFAL